MMRMTEAMASGLTMGLLLYSCTSSTARWGHRGVAEPQTPDGGPRHAAQEASPRSEGREGREGREEERRE
jgi:hypothetical protein